MSGAPADHLVGVQWHAVLCVADLDLESRLTVGLADAGYVVTSVCAAPITWETLPANQPAIVLIDDRGSDWLRLVADLTNARPLARPVLLWSAESAEGFLAALTAGVAGFCAANAPLDAVLRTIASVRDSGVAIPRRMVAPLVEHMRHGRGHSVRTAAGMIDVTDREWQILQLMLQRRSTREMAKELYVSVGTVRSHVSALLHKLGAVDRDDAIALVERGRHA